MHIIIETLLEYRPGLSRTRQARATIVTPSHPNCPLDQPVIKENKRRPILLCLNHSNGISSKTESTAQTDSLPHRYRHGIQELF